MARLNKNDLKKIVKECLFEILLEASEGDGQILESRKAKKPQPRQKAHPALDNIRVGKKPKAKPVKRNPIDVSSITSDPVMAAIFQDTAATTLVEQSAAEKNPRSHHGGDSAARAVAQSDPQDLFGDASKNWAALAFND